MKTVSKVGLVIGGYIAAFGIAWTVDYVLGRLNTSADPNGGMQAFGDMLRFLGLFAVLALFPTVLALYFLRPVEKFWDIFSIAALVIAATGPVAEVMMGRHHLPPFIMFPVGSLGLLKILGSPLFCIGFAICALISPSRIARWRLLGAAGIEFVVIVYGVFCLVVVKHWL